MVFFEGANRVVIDDWFYSSDDDCNVVDKGLFFCQFQLDEGVINIAGIESVLNEFCCDNSFFWINERRETNGMIHTYFNCVLDYRDCGVGGVVFVSSFIDNIGLFIQHFGGRLTVDSFVRWSTNVCWIDKFVKSSVYNTHGDTVRVNNWFGRRFGFSIREWVMACIGYGGSNDVLRRLGKLPFVVSFDEVYVRHVCRVCGNRNILTDDVLKQFLLEFGSMSEDDDNRKVWINRVNTLGGNWYNDFSDVNSNLDVEKIMSHLQDAFNTLANNSGRRGSYSVNYEDMGGLVGKMGDIMPKPEWITEKKANMGNLYNINLDMEEIENTRKKMVRENMMSTICNCDYYVNFNILSENEMRLLGISYVDARNIYLNRKKGEFVLSPFELDSVLTTNGVHSNSLKFKCLPLQFELISSGVSHDEAESVYFERRDRFLRSREELEECFDACKLFGVYFCVPCECDWRINIFEKNDGRLLNVDDDGVCEDGGVCSVRHLEL